MKKESGFTLIELTISLLVSGIVAAGAYYTLSSLFQGTERFGAKGTAQSEIDQLVADVRWQFRARGPGASIAAIPGPFTAASGIGCTGLSITQPDPAGGTREVRYVTECVAGTADPQAHHEVDCGPAGKPRVRVTYLPSGRERIFPVGGEVTGVAMCFRVDAATGVTLEAGASFRAGRRGSIVLTPVYLTSSDRSAGVQIFPN